MAPKSRKPPSLYDSCLSVYVRNLNHNVASLDRIGPELRLLPMPVLASVYEQMCAFDSLKDILLVQLTDLDTFCRLIKQTSLKQTMFKCVQTLMTARKPIVTELRTQFCRATSVYYLQSTYTALLQDATLESIVRNRHRTRAWSSYHEVLDDFDATVNVATVRGQVKGRGHRFASSFVEQIDNGIRLGSFLSESGWLEESLHVFNITLTMIQLLRPSYGRYLIELNCLQKLLCVQTAYCCFKEASITCAQALNIIDKLTEQHRKERKKQKPQEQSTSSMNRSRSNDSSSSGRSTDYDKLSNIPNCLLANIYQQISVLHFYRSEYDLSYQWSLRSVKHLNKNTPDKIAVDVLRQVAKSCVVKRQFSLASMLIKQAVCRARASFGTVHQKYADALLDYGFFLLNVDAIANSVAVYSEAHDILCRIFGPRNLHVAVAHEDLAYCLYVLEYSSGKFDAATTNVERAIDIMKELVPSNHLLLASAKRVKALILEEIALDSMITTVDHNRCKSLLEQSEELHRSALQLSLEAFGEINVQTAKHYGNLGRLYQSMGKFDAAEQMHKRAIKIKTHILGPYDYEVGLSVGHLASLYNYHMLKYAEAEELYLKSIEISLRLFGESYSGLEYDYRGLIHIFEVTVDLPRLSQYHGILEEWRMLREENRVVRNNFSADLAEDSTIEEVTQRFFEMCSNSEISCQEPVPLNLDDETDTASGETSAESRFHVSSLDCSSEEVEGASSNNYNGEENFFAGAADESFQSA